MQTIAKQLRRLREQAKQSGHDTARVSIGIDGDRLRLCDDSGAYDYHYSAARLVRVCVGAPSRACEHIALLLTLGRPCNQ